MREAKLGFGWEDAGLIIKVNCSDIYSKQRGSDADLALQFILKAAPIHSLFRHECRQKGFLYDVRFFYISADREEYRYAIIPTKQWLLWYFRKPALAKFRPDIKELKADFCSQHKMGKVNVNNAGEITVRLFDTNDVKKMMDKYLK